LRLPLENLLPVRVKNDRPKTSLTAAIAQLLLFCLGSLYSYPKSFVNCLLPDRGFGEGWGGVKNLRLLQGLLYIAVLRKVRYSSNALFGLFGQSPRTPHVTEKGYIYPIRCKLRSLDRQRMLNTLGKCFPPSYYLFSLAGWRISSAKSTNFGPSCSDVTQTSDTHLR
jgi:hypothetical protein